MVKQFTDDKSLPGNDHSHVMDKDDRKLFFKKMDEAYNFLGDYEKIFGDGRNIKK